MAKKEKNIVGYLVLSIIPIIGIIWAGVAGIQHSSYVRSAKEAEDKFEVSLKEKMNLLLQSDYADSETKAIGDLNLTSVVVHSYASKLLNDDLNADRSFTLTLGANPVDEDKRVENINQNFEFVYEFFITYDDYNLITKSFSNQNIGIAGYEDYTYVSYYPNNPKSALIYPLETIFEERMNYVNYFKYKSEVITSGGSVEILIDAIDALGEITYESKAALDKIADSYNNLPEEQKEMITNYTIYEQACITYSVKNVEHLIEIIGSVDDITYSSSRLINDARNAYKKLTDQDASLGDRVTNYADLTAAEFRYDVVKVIYYIAKIDLTNISSSATAIKNSVKFYNNLKDEQKVTLDTTNFEKLQSAVEEYNKLQTTESNRLTLQIVSQ